MAAIDPSASAVATSALQAIPFSELIGGPLDAAVQAQYKAAQTTWEFINQVGLYMDKDTGEKKAVQVVFQYQKAGEMVNLVVPLITIVPIPYLGVDELTIDFIANISASSSTYNETSESENINAELSGGAEVGWGPFKGKVDFKGGYSSKKDSKATQESQYSVEYTMSVHVAASGGGQMPAGLASVLNILNSSIEESKTKGSLKADRRILKLSGTDPVILEAVLKDSKGLLVSGQDVTFTQEAGIGTGVFSVEDGATESLYAIVSPAAPNALQSASPAIATDSSGISRAKITGATNGLAALKITATLNDVELTDRVTVHISGISGPSITLDSTTVNVTVGSTQDVIATVTGDDTITSVKVESDKTSVFTVESSVTVTDGQATITVTGVAAGSGKLTVTAEGTPSVQATATVNVTSA